jgi:hypothetical protein
MIKQKSISYSHAAVVEATTCPVKFDAQLLPTAQKKWHPNEPIVYETFQKV